jgi:hypothetical protein
MSTRKFTIPAVGAVALLLNACIDHLPMEVPEQPAIAQRNVAPAAPAKPPRPQEETFSRVAAIVPEFGGLFSDSQGNLVAYLADGGDNAALRRMLAPMLAQRQQESTVRPVDLIIRRGQYTYAELVDWRDRIFNVGAELRGLSFLDLREGWNRLEVGVVDATAEAAVLERVELLGIPRGAVVTTVSGYFNSTVAIAAPTVAPTLTSNASSQYISQKIRPLRGGTLIRHYEFSSIGNVCTLGFIARGTDGSWGAVTNSHCSREEWNVDYTWFFQPGAVTGENNRIGRETYDPRGSICWVYWRCRSSDASWIALSDGVGGTPEYMLGAIARTMGHTTGWNAGHGSFEIDQNMPIFQIIAERDPYEGDRADKVGAATGWTSGTVLNTCVDSWFSDGQYHLKPCQATVSFTVDGGDSGAPVFIPHFLHPQHPSAATLLGIFWGKNDDRAIFSKMSQVQRDLAGFYTY